MKLLVPYILLISSVAMAQDAEITKKEKNAKAAIYATSVTSSLLSAHGINKTEEAYLNIQRKSMEAATQLEKKSFSGMHEIENLDGIAANDLVKLNYKKADKVTRQSTSYVMKSIVVGSSPEEILKGVEKIAQEGGKVKSFNVISGEILENGLRRTSKLLAPTILYTFLFGASAVGGVLEYIDGNFSKAIVKKSVARLDADRSSTLGAEKSQRQQLSKISSQGTKKQ